jgi:hypothetical protein
MRCTLIALLLVGCGGSKAHRTATAAKLLSERPADGGLIEQLIDVNGDGQRDVINYLRERSEATRLLVRKEVDLNWDGKIDVRTWFDEEGRIEKEEMDGDFDGRPDWVDHYNGGQRVMSEIDTDYNGTPDLFKYYEQGKVRKKERDTDGDGRPDFWEYLDDKGNVLRTAADTDGDGEMDVRQD